MESTRRRMMAVAVTVCGFAVGMAGLLNYFKYRTTAQKVVVDRMVVTAKAVENSIQSALALGMQFSEIGTMQGTLERERATDDLIVGIDVFDTDGKPLYSTDRLRADKPAPAAWMKAAQRSGKGSWQVDDDEDTAAGIAVKNNFEQPIGYLAVRYSGERVRAEAWVVGRTLALQALATFVLASLAAALAVMWVTRGLARDMHAVEAALRRAAGESAEATPEGVAAPGAVPAVEGDLGRALRRFLRTSQKAERRIAAARASLNQGL